MRYPVILALAILHSGVSYRASADEAWPDRAVLDALKKTISVDFHNTPLTEVAECLAIAANVDIAIDRKALDDVGLDPDDVKATVKLDDISLQSVLRIVLREHDLTIGVPGKKLTITTPGCPDGLQFVRVYPVRDLVMVEGDNGEWYEDEDWLIELITSGVAPNSWDEVGGPGVIQSVRETLIIEQTFEGHQEIEKVLAALRKFPPVGKDKAADAPRSVRVFAPENVDKQKAVLAEKASCNFKETPLQEVVEFFRKRHRANIVIDRRSLADVGIPLRTPVTAKLDDVTLAEALRTILRDLDLTYFLRDEVIIVAIPEEAEMYRAIVLYRVSDLIPAGDDYERLAQTIQQTVDSNTWDEVGGPGWLKSIPARGLLAVSQTDDVHAKIEWLLEELRAAEKRQRPAAGDDLDEIVLRAYVLSVHQNRSHAPQRIKAAKRALKRVVFPASWQDKQHFAIAAGDRLLVRHRRGVQREIRDFLRPLGLNAAGPKSPIQFGTPGGEGGGLFSVPD